MGTGQFTITSLDRQSALEILDWRYPPPYGLYNITPGDAEAAISEFLDPDLDYYQMKDGQGKLAAFFNFGGDARVPGGDYSEEALDIGLGVHPDRIGQGHGADFVRAVLEFARQKERPHLYRVTIAEFNMRARHLWEKAGFKETQRFQRPMDGMAFVILTARDPAI